MSGIFRCGYSQPNLATTVIGMQHSDKSMKKAIELSEEGHKEHFQGNMELLQIRLENTRKNKL